MAAGNHLNPTAAVVLKFGEQCVLFIGRKAIAGRVSNDGNATGTCNPMNSIFQRSPAVRYKARFIFSQVFAKHFRRIFADTRLNQEPRKVRARNEFVVACIFECTFVGPVYAHLGQAFRHFFGALGSAATRVAQALHQVCVGVIKAQAHNVDCFACKGNGNFNAREVLHVQGFGRSDGAFLATNFVMVCEGPKLHPIGFGARSQSLRRERAIGHHGVAM